jgi:hypothetical protein
MTEVPPPPPHTIHHRLSNDILSDPTTNYLNQKTYGTDLYDAFLEECQAHHCKAEATPHSKCDDNEANGIKMNVRQPSGMWNYTNMDSGWSSSLLGWSRR